MAFDGGNESNDPHTIGQWQMNDQARMIGRQTERKAHALPLCDDHSLGNAHWSFGAAGAGGRSAGFTLIELLVVISVIALLVSILVPALSAARQIAQSAKCKNSIRAIQVGNELYQADHNGLYAPAAAGYMRNLDRWFGSRTVDTAAFTGEGPLSRYLAGGAVRECPTFVKFLRGFEAGGGGYGYNQWFVGMRVKPGEPVYAFDGSDCDRSGNRADIFAQPSATVAFADAAFAAKGGLIEYSFAEPPRYSTYLMEPRPSIHFRHQGRANVAWLDCHVTDEPMSFTSEALDSFYNARCADFGIGWFGPKGIDLFDCR